MKSLSALVMASMSVAGFLLAGCSAGGGSSDAPRVVKDGYDKISCAAAPPDQGRNALMGNASKTQFLKADFEKPYDRFDLEAVLDASAVSTTEYVKSLGVGLFRVPRADLGRACQTYFNLDSAPGELAAVWERVSGGVGGGGRLAGIYWENCKTNCRDFELVSPTILVDEASDRWTLVHEMMHHNFNLSRKADRSIPGYTPQVREMQRSVAKIDKQMKEYKAQASEAVLTDIANEAELLARTLYSLGVRGVLEEVALEGLLLKEWTEGRLKGGSQGSAESSLWYMTGSRENGLRPFENVRTVTQFVRGAATEKSWALPPALERTEAYIQWVKDSTQAVITEAKARVQNKTGVKIQPMGFVDFSGAKMKTLETHLSTLEGYEALTEFNELMDDLRARHPALNSDRNDF